MQTPSPRRLRQQGASFFELIFWAIVISFLALVAVKTLPTLNEYFTIQGAIRKVMAGNPGSIPEIRTAFERQKTIEYSITSISGNDLEIEQGKDGFVVSFGYDKEIELIAPVYLLIKYRGASR